MSPWVMVTAYFARSCWISTRASVRVMSEDLTVLHYKVDLLCNGNIGQRITRNGDDVGEVALGDAAEVGLVDQVRCDDGGRAEHRCGWHAPFDERHQFVGVPAVWDRRSVGADSDLGARLVRGLDRCPCLREHLGGLVLQ